jgi:hypothetical protein
MTTRNEDMTSLTRNEATDIRMLSDSELDAVSGGQIGLGNFAKVAWDQVGYEIVSAENCLNGWRYCEHT